MLLIVLIPEWFRGHNSIVDLIPILVILAVLPVVFLLLVFPAHK